MVLFPGSNDFGLHKMRRVSVIDLANRILYFMLVSYLLLPEKYSSLHVLTVSVIFLQNKNAEQIPFPSVT